MGRLAVVTGANRGLGYAIVRELSEHGWDVLALTRTSPEPADGNGPPGVVRVQHDVRSGPLRLTQFLLPSLLAAPDPVIVNVSSRLGSVSAQVNGDFADLSTSFAYKISKAAQNMLTVSLAQELHGRVRCWAVHPGKLATSMGQADAAKDPAIAARELRELVDSDCRISPRFCSLGAEDLAW